MNDADIQEAMAVPTFRLGRYWFYQDKLIVNFESVDAIVVDGDRVAIYRFDACDGIWLDAATFAAPLIAAFKEYQIWKITTNNKGE